MEQNLENKMELQMNRLETRIEKMQEMFNKDLAKDKDWLSGYKNKTPIYAVYKRPTSKQGTHSD